MSNSLTNIEIDHFLDQEINELLKPNFKFRTANQRILDAVNQPEILPLLGNIWMQNELHILFADTGYGKSLFAVQICNDLSKGKKVFIFENPHAPLKTLILDFELTDRQFLKRYSDDYKNYYQFSDNLFVDSIDIVELQIISPSLTIEEIIFREIKKAVEIMKPDILTIDNITFLNQQSTQETQVALQVMRLLNEIKKNTGLSILVLAHTPKRNLTQPLTINDLAGSKHLSNFADSVSAIGTSHIDSKLRYIKQVKPSRSSEMEYDSTNVITCELVKNDCFLGFEFVRFSSEKEHLLDIDDDKRKELKEQALFLHQSGKSYREIASEIGVGKTTISRWVNELSLLSLNNNNRTAGQTGQ